MSSSIKATLYTDGGSRGNPGPAAIGYVLTIKNDRVIEHGSCLGVATNNQAEYQALIAGLKRAQHEGVASLSCYLDSELIVKQLSGKYRVKKQELIPLNKEVNSLAKSFQEITFTHIKREKNSQADRLVNQALDDMK